MTKTCKTKKYYYDYLPRTKSGISKRKHSKSFCSFQSAIKDARNRQKSGKIVQAQFWKIKSPIDHRILSSLNTKGQVQARRYS